MPKQTKKEREAEELARWEKEQDEFDKNRLYHICKFILECQRYRKLFVDVGEYNSEPRFNSIKLEDGEFKLVQEMGIDDAFVGWSITISTDIDSDTYTKQMRDLSFEISFLENIIKEQLYVKNLKQVALAKLTKEEKEVLGL